jgi:hypothetical protein
MSFARRGLYLPRRTHIYAQSLVVCHVDVTERGRGESANRKMHLVSGIQKFRREVEAYIAGARESRATENYGGSTEYHIVVLLFPCCLRCSPCLRGELLGGDAHYFFAMLLFQVSR